MKNVLVLCANPDDGTAWWRMISPLSHLSKSGLSSKVRFHFPSKSELKDLSGGATFPFFDLVIAQRPFKSNHLATLSIVKDCNIPLWVDYDDNLIEVPFSNRCFKTYSDRRIQQNISVIIKMADVVTTATDPLTALYGSINEHAVTVPNAFDSLHLEERRLDKKFGAKIISWRGSTTHEEDLDEYLSAMEKVHDKYPDWTWQFFGGTPWFINKIFKKGSVHIYDPLPRMKYFKFLNSKVCTPDIGIVPLKRNNFNIGKSNIAWIEHTYAGAATLVPDFPEWASCDGSTQYQDKKSFEEKLCELIEMSEEGRAKLNKKSWEKVRNTYSLEVANKIRIKLLEDLLGTKLQ